MKRLKQIRRLRKGWKIFGAFLIVLFMVSGYMLYVNASTNVYISLSNEGATERVASGEQKSITATLTGKDDEAVNELNPDGTPNPGNIVWTSSDSNVVALSDAAGTVHDSVTGSTATYTGMNAGVAKITANYYSIKYDETGREVSRSAVATKDFSVIVPIDIKTDIDTSRIYKTGDIINISANTSELNKMIIETSNNGVVEVSSSTNSSAVLKVIGGGKTTITVRTKESGSDASLMKKYSIMSEVKFNDGEQNDQGHQIVTNNGKRVLILEQDDFKDFQAELVPSNVVDPASSGVTYRTSDEKVCKFSDGKVTGIYTGVTKIKAGIVTKDIDGNETWYTSDEIYVVVPFKKTGKPVDNMNVGDKVQLTTSAESSTISWSSSDNSILEVDPSSGMVTAKKAGTATITAYKDASDSLYNELMGVSNQSNGLTLSYTITVIDGFGLNTDSQTVNIGESFDLVALVTNDIDKYPVTFKVENLPNSDNVIPTETLVSTSQNKETLRVTGVASGNVRITASQNVNGVIKTASCHVFISTPVGEVTINPSSLSIDRGSKGTVQLLFNPAGPTNDKVLWSSSNPDVATVKGDSYTAEITGVKGGSATITVITEDGLKVATCDVYVREPVTGITLNATTVESTMAIGQYQLVATVLPAGEGVNRNVTWTSSNTDVCTVSDTGLVTYKKPGYATIICKTEDGAYMATCNFVISIPVESIKLDYTNEIMSLGSTLRITAEVLPLTASNRTVQWESSNTNVCIVDSNGLVEAVGTGNCTILCKSLDGNCTAMCNIYVKQPVTQVVLNTTEITVRKGQTFWLNATCLPENADNKIIEWSSRDENICKVENDGKVTATGAGITSIIATNKDTGLTAYCVVTVTQPVTGIKLNSDYQQLWVGAKYAIIPYVEPVDAENKNVTYMSSDSSVATVDENGVVTAVKGGSCIIEVKTEECGLIAACTIDVKEYVSSISLSETDKYMNIGTTGVLKASVGSDTATNKTISWSSSNNGICSVDGNGNVHAQSPGTAVITATAADGSGVSATCVIHSVNPVTSITVEPSTVRMLQGDSRIVRAVIYPENATIKNVRWVSSNESVATVDEQGEVFGVGVGKAKITAISCDGNEVKGVCWVYVTPVVNISSLKINSSEIYMLAGKSRKLSVRVRPAYNTDSYSWYSTDTGIVTVDGNGVIRTVGPGTADVVVESENAGVSSTCTVHSLAISRSSIRLEQYDSYWLDIIGTQDKVTWRSSNPRVCTVTQSGHVVARKAGTTTVTAVVDGKTLSCVVRVTNIR